MINYLCVITARMASSRLPGKVMMKIENTPIIKILFDRVNKSKVINDIVVATTFNKKDQVLVDYLKKKNINVFRGDEENVTKIVIDVGKKFRAKNIVFITGDCPLVDKNLIDQCIRTFHYNDCDFVNNSNIRSFPDGLDVQVFKLSSLIKAYKNIKKKKELEHVTLSLRRNPRLFKTINLVAGPKLNYPKVFITLDEKNDFKLIKKLAKYFWKKGNKDFSSHEIVNFINKKKLTNLNINVKRKGDK